MRKFVLKKLRRVRKKKGKKGKNDPLIDKVIEKMMNDFKLEFEGGM